MSLHGNEPRSSARMRSPYPALIRPIRGESDLAVVVSQGLEGLTLAVWDASSREVRPLDWPHTAYGTTVTTDGRFILDLDDPTGSELGHVHAFPVGGGTAVNLTPGRGAYTVRGIDSSLDGRSVLLTIADDDGFSAVLSSLDQPGDTRTVFHSAHEAWSGILSADAMLAAVETTDHNPGIRRFAVTVVEVVTGREVGVLTDGPLGPVRPVRFAQDQGDGRLLACTEASGFARPVVWDPRSGERVDVQLTHLDGDVVPLDWHSPSGRLLLVHVDGGVHRLLEHDLARSETTPLAHPPGSFFEPDVAAEFPHIWSSYYAHDGTRRLVRGRWDSPLEVLESKGAEDPVVVLAAAAVPPATPFTSHLLTSADGTRVQLWVGMPADRAQRRGTILELHGGPNLATVDRYDATAQAWVDDGWVFASLNYRGSVTFGREFREAFWGRVGEGELDDIAAAADWLEKRGLASADSLFVTGQSYGGFLTLMAMGRLPDRFAGGLALVAQADWVSAYGQMNAALRAAWRGFIGASMEEDVDRWRRASPIAYVDSLRAPVWLNQGEHDTRTPPEQAARYAEAVRAAGGDVLLEWFPGGHMPGGLAGLEHDYLRMRELVGRALRGERWDALGGGAPPGWVW